MTSRIILINDTKDVNQIKDNSKDKIYALNFMVHKELNENNIDHEIGDKILSKKDREEIFHTTTKFHKWFLDQSFSLDFTLFDVNILGMFDKAEMHSYIIHKLLRFITIKKIIEKENPETIIISSNLREILEEISSVRNTKFVIFEERVEEKLEYENYSFIVNVGSKPISINISRKQYALLKKTIDEIVGRIFNLWYRPRKNKKTVMLLEFNPIQAKTFLEKLSKNKFQVVIFNSRRPAAWNLESLKILKKYNIKIVNSRLLIDNNIKNEINKMNKLFRKKFELLWKNQNELKRIFSLGEVSLWPVIQNKFIQVYNERLEGYLQLIYSSKKLFNESSFKCVLCLNAVGETETAVLNVESNKSPSILLEHGFANYTNETGKYDSLSYYHFLKDKIAVWGNSQKEYLISSGRVNEENILVTGSIKHDSFFGKPKIIKTRKMKTLLLTLHPINEYTGNGSIENSINFEESVKEICKIIKKVPNIEVIVKLHPGHSESDEYVKNMFQKNLENAKILQITPIHELLETTDILINLTPEAADPTTVLLEAMFMEVPILQINLDEYKYDYDYIKDQSIIELTRESDIEKELIDFINNKRIQEKLVANGKRHVQKYLVNIGTASEKLVEVIEEI